jgi:acetate CoA/acetoacetate CoA-transferase beta subunit
MPHVARGRSKVGPEPTLPPTAARKVTLLVTDLAVLQPTADGMVLRERPPGISVEAVCEATAASLIIPAEVPEMAHQA